MINILILIISNIFFLITLYSMLTEIGNLSKIEVGELKSSMPKENISATKNSMIVFVVMGVVTYATFIKLVVEMYIKR